MAEDYEMHLCHDATSRDKNLCLEKVQEWRLCNLNHRVPGIPPTASSLCQLCQLLTLLELHRYGQRHEKRTTTNCIKLILRCGQLHSKNDIFPFSSLQNNLISQQTEKVMVFSTWMSWVIEDNCNTYFWHSFGGTNLINSFSHITISNSLSYSKHIPSSSAKYFCRLAVSCGLKTVTQISWHPQRILSVAGIKPVFKYSI